MGAVDSLQSADVIHVISLRKRREKEQERIIIILVKTTKIKRYKEYTYIDWFTRIYFFIYVYSSSDIKLFSYQNLI